MAVSAENIICPYCAEKHNKHDILGNSGLINYNGTERAMECAKCKQIFRCNMEVTIKFKTYKD